jgi:hypothetical protein
LHHILLLITKHLQKSFSLAYCAPFCKLVLDGTAGTVNISIAVLKTIVCNIFLAKTFVHIFSPNFQSLETPSDAIPPFVHPISTKHEHPGLIAGGSAACRVQSVLAD